MFIPYLDQITLLGDTDSTYIFYLVVASTRNFYHHGCSNCTEFLNWVIPYQFTKVLRMIPSELDEIWCVGSPGGHMYPKGIFPKLFIWLPRNGLLNILLFLIFAIPMTIQSIITWAFSFF